MCQKFVELYESDDILCEATAWSSRSGKSVSDDVKRQCDSLNLGCLVKGLKKYQIILDPLATDDVHGSVRKLTGRLRSLPCFPLDGNDSIHRRCTFTTRIHDWIMCVERDVSPSGMDESHLKHMEEQAKK